MKNLGVVKNKEATPGGGCPRTKAINVFYALIIIKAFKAKANGNPNHKGCTKGWKSDITRLKFSQRL